MEAYSDFDVVNKGVEYDFSSPEGEERQNLLAVLEWMKNDNWNCQNLGDTMYPVRHYGSLHLWLPVSHECQETCVAITYG